MVFGRKKGPVKNSMQGSTPGSYLFTNSLTAKQDGALSRARKATGLRSAAATIICALLWAFTTGQAIAQPPVPTAIEPSFSRAEVPTVGEGTSVLNVTEFGRYSIWVESDTGVALQLVDKMAGPGDWKGQAGESDGRLDVFLDRGDVLIRSLGTPPPTPAGGTEDEPATDAKTASLKVERFRPRSERAVFLPPDHQLSEELVDFEALSWWLKVDQRERVILEAAGRHLADLRLWRDGTWLEGAEPLIEEIEPIPGQPLRLCRLSTVLEPGLYRLVAYGGPSADWTEDDGSRPLYIRSGVPSAPEAARRRLSLSPFGFDRFLVPSEASYFRLELGAEGPAGEQTSLQVGDWREEAPFADEGILETITKENRVPVAEIELNVRHGDSRIIRVAGRAGESFVLQHFRAEEIRRFQESGEYFIGTVHAGAVADSLEATAFLTRNENRSNDYQKSIQSRAVELSRGVVIRRRFNLHQEGSLFLTVKDAGDYELKASGDGDADLRLEPWFAPNRRPKDYRQPEARSGGGEWQLDPGFYRLTLLPRRPGILSLLMRSLDESMVLPLDQQPIERSAILFSAVRLNAKDRYSLHLNQVPGVRSGAVIRPLPLNLEEPLPLVADDPEPVELPFHAERSGRIVAEAEDGGFLDVSVDGAPWDSAGPAGAGTHRVRVRPSAGQELPTAYSLAWVPDAWSAPPPPVPTELLALPQFPRIEPGRIARFELDSQQRQTFQIEVERAALYRLESTGLLDTEGVLRTRVRPALQTRTEGGDGRNFAVQMYLRPGTYQTEVSARSGEGRAGLRLFSAPIRNGGRLRQGVPARGWLKAGEALEYAFEITAEDRYRIRTQGLGRNFPIRLEDHDGWPLLPPGGAGDLTILLKPGSYRWVVLPQEVDARQWTLLEPIDRPLKVEGPGPYELPLDRRVDHLWLEPEQGIRGDRWLFHWPADAEARIHLSEGMEGELFRDRERIATLPRNKGFEGRLSQGPHELRIRSARVDNRVAYHLRVEPVPMMIGTSRTVEVPSELDVAVGQEGLVELSSLGRIDVRARLFTLVEEGKGEFIAEADDRPGDWNFRLSRRLAKGTYRLVLEAVSQSGQAEISMGRPEEKIEPSWTLPLGRAESRSLLSDSATYGAVRLPLVLPPGADALLVHAQSADHVRLTLEAGSEERGFREGTAVSLVMPLVADSTADPTADLTGDASAGTSGGPWTLRVESLDQSGNEIQVHVAAITTERITEAGASGGVNLRQVPGMPGEIGILAVDLDRPGCFRLASATSVGSRAGHALDTTDALVSATGSVIWLGGAVDRQVGLQRHTLTAGASPVRLWLPGRDGGVCDVSSTAQASSWVIAEGLAGPIALAGGHGDFSVHDSDGRQSLVAVDSNSVLIRPGDGQAGDVDLRLVTVEPPRSEPADWGNHELKLAPFDGIRLNLPEGRKKLRLTLSKGLAAVLGEGRGQVVWARTENRQVSLDTDLSIAIHDLGGQGGVAAVAGLPSGPESGSVLEWARPWERVMDQAGSTVLQIPKVDDSVNLWMLGARDAVWRSTDGRVQRGANLRLEPGQSGSLTLDHSVGWLVARLVVSSVAPSISRSVTRTVTRSVTSESASAASLGFSPAAEQPTRPIIPPARVEIVGDSPWQIETSELSVLHLSTPEPVAAWLRAGDSRTVSGVFPEGMRLYLPTAAAGVAELRLRGLGGRLLGGFLEVQSNPVLDIGEGLGPETLLKPGETRFYRFVVSETGTVGFGAHAESGEVEGLLIDRHGRELGRGAVQMAELEAGEYFFALSLGVDQRPVKARPAVVGLHGPGTGPPRDVIEDYLDLRVLELSALGDEP